jgi:hypothetical protein
VSAPETVRSFLVKTPRPHRIVVRTEEDEVHELDGSAVGKGGLTWANVARSVEALTPKVIEAYDAEGKLLRAKRGDEETSPQQQSAGLGLATIQTDPETARLTHFANLLYRATEFSTTLAFTKMVELFQLQAERASALEARLERAEETYRKAIQQRIDEAFDAAEEQREQAEAIRAAAEAGQSDTAMALLQSFMGGAEAGKQERTPPNGKGKS